MVDNCYGEFVERIEPTDVGADLCVGSMIKNPGGGRAPIGGYIVGKEAYVENCSDRLTSPCLGKEVGATLGVMQSFYPVSYTHLFSIPDFADAASVAESAVLMFIAVFISSRLILRKLKAVSPVSLLMERE